KIKGITNTYNPGCISLYRPDNALINTYVMIPAAIPLPKLKVNIVNTIVIIAGNDSVVSSRIIFFTALRMEVQTIINVEEVASVSTRIISGVINSISKNTITVVTEVKPLRPPDSTPEADSTYVVLTGKERKEPNAVPPAS